MEKEYLPVQWVYKEVIEDEISKSLRGKIFYFDDDRKVCMEEGRITKMEELAEKGVFIHLDNGRMVRIDRIISLFGKPGAAYELYDSLGNACLDCTGGYDIDDL